MGEEESRTNLYNDSFKFILVGWWFLVFFDGESCVCLLFVVDSSIFFHFEWKYRVNKELKTKLNEENLLWSYYDLKFMIFLYEMRSS